MMKTTTTTKMMLMISCFVDYLVIYSLSCWYELCDGKVIVLLLMMTMMTMQMMMKVMKMMMLLMMSCFVDYLTSFIHLLKTVMTMKILVDQTTSASCHRPSTPALIRPSAVVQKQWLTPRQCSGTCIRVTGLRCLKMTWTSSGQPGKGLIQKEWSLRSSQSLTTRA